MKTPEEMMEFFRAMPSKKKENPYWTFNEEQNRIEVIRKNITEDSVAKDEDPVANVPLHMKSAIPLLRHVRAFFRAYHESFQSEAQVLCVTQDDAMKLNAMGIPVLTSGTIGMWDVAAVVLPQDNTGGNSRISEYFWQTRIVNEGIRPIARIHSHHVLDPYQSMTDYSTLNSGTLEIVIGKIYHDELCICYWLDVPGTDIKAQTFVAKEVDGSFDVVPHKFHSPDAVHFYAAPPGEWLEKAIKENPELGETVIPEDN